MIDASSVNGWCSIRAMIVVAHAPSSGSCCRCNGIARLREALNASVTPETGERDGPRTQFPLHLSIIILKNAKHGSSRARKCVNGSTVKQFSRMAECIVHRLFNRLLPRFGQTTHRY